MGKTLARKRVERTVSLPGVSVEFIPDFPTGDVEVWEKNPRELQNLNDHFELVGSIKEVGVQEPLKIFQPAGSDGKYKAFDGGRRLRAAKSANQAKVPVLLYHGLTDTMALSLAVMFNVSSRKMNPEDEGKAFQCLAESGVSLEEIRKTAGCSLNFVKWRIAMCNLPKFIKDALSSGEITKTDMELLVRCPEGQRESMLDKIRTFRGSLAQMGTDTKLPPANGPSGNNTKVNDSRAHDIRVEAMVIGELGDSGERILSKNDGVDTLLPDPIKRPKGNPDNSSKRGRKTPATPIELLLRELRRHIEGVSRTIEILMEYPDDQLSLERIAQLMKEGRFGTSVISCLGGADRAAGDLEDFLTKMESLGHDVK